MNEKLLLESIRLIDGQCPLLPYHQERVDRSRKLFYPKAPQLKLRAIIDELDLPSSGTYKIRLTYGKSLETQEIKAYTIRPVHSLRLIDANKLRYAKKYEDRHALNDYFERRAGHDDILMVQNGFLTDSSYSNVALFDGIKWFTPSTPLLRGTRRAQLLKEGIIKKAVIREKDLVLFKKLRLINAMLPWGVGPEIPIESVQRD